MNLDDERIKLIGVIESATDNMLSYTMDEKIADALIESGLVVDDKVYLPYATDGGLNNSMNLFCLCGRCRKKICVYEKIHELSYCPYCGCKLKE